MDYTPWRSGRFTIGVGLRAPTTPHIFLGGDGLARLLENKAQVRRERLAKYYPPHHDLSSEELAHATNYLRGQILAAGLPIKTHIDGPGFRDDLDQLACSVAEDIALWKRDDEKDWLAALHLCAPNHWSPEEKIGKSFLPVHAPVPKIAPVAQIALKLFDQILERGLQERLAWGVATDDRPNHHPAPPVGVAPSEWQGRSFDEASPRLFARVERQTVSPVPHTRLIVFTIRTYFVDVRTLSREDRDLMSLALDSMDEEILRYKGLFHDRPLIQRWLKSF